MYSLELLDQAYLSSDNNALFIQNQLENLVKKCDQKLCYQLTKRQDQSRQVCEQRRMGSSTSKHNDKTIEQVDLHMFYDSLCEILKLQA